MYQASPLIQAAMAASAMYRDTAAQKTLRQSIALASDKFGVVRGKLSVYMMLKAPHLVDTMPVKQECCTNVVQLGLELAL